VAEYSVSIADLKNTADEFMRAGRDSQAVLKRLDKSMAMLEKSWDGVSQEAFYKHFNEWKNLMQGHIALLHRIAQEMTALAERYENADH
jgi:WXG100 family type VII secretion target